MGVIQDARLMGARGHARRKPGRLSDCRGETPSSDERGLRRLTSFSQIQSRLWSAYGSRDSLSDAYMEHSR